jgi:hypothetical protein
MATEVTAAKLLDLEEHGRRLLERYTEPLLTEDFDSPCGRRAREAAQSGLYGHLWEMLERWHQGRRDKRAG